MPRYRLLIEYDGRGFVGWQRQSNGTTVQQALEEAVHAFSGESPEVVGAGRTDSGVHALGQAAHLDLETDRFAPEKLKLATNAHLREVPVVVLEAHLAEPEFHARFSATGRKYLYRISNRSAPPALDAGRVWHVARALDVDAMSAAAKTLLGNHDFTSFRAVQCQAASPVKTLDRLDVLRVADEVHVVAEARSFLHHQVRNFVGTLALVGHGRWSPSDVNAALDARDRSAAGPTAPPDGLYLTEVVYGEPGAAAREQLWS